MCKGEMAQLDSCLIAPMVLLVNHFVGEMVNQTFSNDITDFLKSEMTSDMRFVKNFTLPDFPSKDFTPLISLNFNSLNDKNTKK